MIHLSTSCKMAVFSAMPYHCVSISAYNDGLIIWPSILPNFTITEANLWCSVANQQFPPIRTIRGTLKLLIIVLSGNQSEKEGQARGQLLVRCIDSPHDSLKWHHHWTINYDLTRRLSFTGCLNTGTLQPMEHEVLPLYQSLYMTYEKEPPLLAWLHKPWGFCRCSFNTWAYSAKK